MPEKRIKVVVYPSAEAMETDLNALADDYTNPYRIAHIVPAPLTFGATGYTVVFTNSRMAPPKAPLKPYQIAHEYPRHIGL